jgi:hypothetical protein
VNHHAAGQHLEVIRTLMERSAIYRRALAPIMLTLGGLGIGAGILGYSMNIVGRSSFVLYWMAIGIIGVAGSFVQMRFQALREHEPFWSPPTRRVTQAITPALVVGGLLGIATLNAPVLLFAVPPLLIVGEPNWWLPPAWMLLYGCAVHAAGFFTPRGFKLFGWGFIGAGIIVWVTLSRIQDGNLSLRLAHLVMATVFGGAHLAYGAYLHITERSRCEA